MPNEKQSAISFVGGLSDDCVIAQKICQVFSRSLPNQIKYWRFAQSFAQFYCRDIIHSRSQRLPEHVIQELLSIYQQPEKPAAIEAFEATKKVWSTIWGTCHIMLMDRGLIHPNDKEPAKNGQLISPEIWDNLHDAFSEEDWPDWKSLAERVKWEVAKLKQREAEVALMHKTNSLQKANDTNNDRIPLDARALAVFIENPSWNKKQLADKLGCHEKSLAPKRCPKLDGAMRAYNAKIEPEQTVRGSIDDDGNIEAWEEDNRIRR